MVHLIFQEQKMFRDFPASLRSKDALPGAHELKDDIQIS